ncbi:hypothetical protein H2201_001326 [Coniosporium apollinis]|uniref:Inner centromere protein ARK-binding domain-containing protein n=2 Tax=Coniosporium TaxID=2810619 RepID=A0ABQ9P339_9PEZI|nr:hypothetical protein H2199_001736 [Cladosporium sp. JES 115]KAJ9668683.1 hypothetical protein H2201_001326 [Coniosporium apollinis]
MADQNRTPSPLKRQHASSNPETTHQPSKVQVIDPRKDSGGIHSAVDSRSRRISHKDFPFEVVERDAIPPEVREGLQAFDFEPTSTDESASTGSGGVKLDAVDPIQGEEPEANCSSEFIGASLGYALSFLNKQRELLQELSAAGVRFPESPERNMSQDADIDVRFPPSTPGDPTQNMDFADAMLVEPSAEFPQYGTFQDTGTNFRFSPLTPLDPTRNMNMDDVQVADPYTESPQRNLFQDDGVDFRHPPPTPGDPMISMELMGRIENAVVQLHAELREHSGPQNVDTDVRSAEPTPSLRTLPSASTESSEDTDSTIEETPEGTIVQSIEPESGVPPEAPQDPKETTPGSTTIEVDLPENEGRRVRDARAKKSVDRTGPTTPFNIDSPDYVRSWLQGVLATKPYEPVRQPSAKSDYSDRGRNWVRDALTKVPDKLMNPPKGFPVSAIRETLKPKWIQGALERTEASDSPLLKTELDPRLTKDKPVGAARWPLEEEDNFELPVDDDHLGLRPKLKKPANGASDRR